MLRMLKIEAQVTGKLDHRSQGIGLKYEKKDCSGIREEYTRSNRDQSGQAEQHQLIQSALQGKELVNSHLRINPAFLLCLMNLILRKSISDQEWRFRVMHFHVAQHNVLICIGIAVAA